MEGTLYHGTISEEKDGQVGLSQAGTQRADERCTIAIWQALVDDNEVWSNRRGLSKRRTSVRCIYQHDPVLSERMCGGGDVRGIGADDHHAPARERPTLRR